MTTRLLFAFLFLSCSGTNADEARKYFGEIIKIMNPFAITTNNVIGELGPLGKSYRANGKKFNSSDSLKILDLLNGFNTKSKVTLEQLNNLKPFDDFDLKIPSVEYVDKLTRIMNLMLNESLTHTLEKQKTSDELSTLINTWKTDLRTAKEKFDLVQMNFKTKFKID